MEELTPAERHYQALKSAQKRYYQKVRQSRIAKYKEDHPNSRPRGRPKKELAEGGSPKAI